MVQAKYDQAMRDKQTLVDDAEACRRKMANATALIDGLGGERTRWTEQSKKFDQQIQRFESFVNSDFIYFSSWYTPFQSGGREALHDSGPSGCEEDYRPEGPKAFGRLSTSKWTIVIKLFSPVWTKALHGFQGSVCEILRTNSIRCLFRTIMNHYSRARYEKITSGTQGNSRVGYQSL